MHKIQGEFKNSQQSKGSVSQLVQDFLLCTLKYTLFYTGAATCRNMHNHDTWMNSSAHGPHASQYCQPKTFSLPGMNKLHHSCIFFSVIRYSLFTAQSFDSNLTLFASEIRRYFREAPDASGYGIFPPPRYLAVPWAVTTYQW